MKIGDTIRLRADMYINGENTFSIVDATIDGSGYIYHHIQGHKSGHISIKSQKWLEISGYIIDTDNIINTQVEEILLALAIDISGQDQEFALIANAKIASLCKLLNIKEFW